MIIIPVLWMALILYGIGVNRNGRRPLELNQSTVLRGICAVEIMMGHFGLMSGDTILYPNRKAGILFVGVFFMLSGYGTAYGVEHKEDYLRHFVLKKVWRLMFPAYLAFLLGMSVFGLFTGAGWQENGWASLFHVKQFIQNTNWYVWEQLALYVVFWVVYRVMPRRTNEVMTVLSVIYIGIAFLIRMDNPWYGSTLCFVLGLYYYRFEERAARLIADHFRMLFAGCVVVLGLSMFIFFAWSNVSIAGVMVIHNPVARNMASMSFCAIVIMLLSKYEVGNKISAFLGRCSYEIFLIHPSIMAALLNVFDSHLVYAVVSMGVSVAAAVVLHWICGKIFKLTGNM